ncbi:MAG: LysM peptidoglycan-binding domain-containing protein [Enterocloster asparagiformis]|nr:LysM peptidoglycan-binding domain-containing protein [Enterocloster asparagiformis]
MEIYIVRPNDNIDQIALAQGVPVNALTYINQLVYPYALALGQALLVPSPDNSPNRTPAETMGYAYPFISPWVLSESLPYLSSLYVFSYGFTEEGELVEPVLDDTWMIEASKAQSARPVFTFTSIGPDGRFHSSLIHTLLGDLRLQQRVIWQLGRVMQEKGFQGIDIDFEYIPAEDRVPFAEFVALVRRIFSSFGYRVSVALAPKTSGDQQGLLYEGIDYRLLGQAADQVMLMTYEWGYTYGPPMAVAPLHMVRRVAEYALTQIPAKKIILGIPNYGYDWPLPYVRGVTKARTIGNVEAVQLAISHGAAIQFDEQSQSPYFHYVQSGIRHEVWFEDVRSYRAKFALIRELGLKGPGFWQMMQLFRAGLILMADTFEITKEFQEKSENFGE